jgi:hypothetical protein
VTIQETRNSFAALILLSLAAVLGGCAAIETKVPVANEPVRGLAYYLPMRYLHLTLVRDATETTSATWDEGPMVPDLSRPFVLEYQRHLFGKAEITLKVGPSGLLGTANTKVSDSAAELVKAFPRTTLAAKALLLDDDSMKECSTGTFVFLYDPAQKQSDQPICGDVRISVGPLLTKEGPKVGDAAQNVPPFGQFGIYYRQLRPYLATATVRSADGAVRHQESKVLMAPNQSPVMLLPYARTLFAANEGQLKLQDGMPEEYVQSTESEFIALLKLPAAVLTAYFKAAGDVFSAFATNAQAEQSLAQQKLALALQAFRIEQCSRALKSEDKAALEELACNKVGSTSN